MEMPPIHRPIPRRQFEITPSSTESSHPPSPVPEHINPDLLSDRRLDTALSAGRTRSILNLTSSTLFGIYSATGNEGTPQEMATPWGTGAQTPSQRRSTDSYQPEEPDVRWARGKPETTSRWKRSGLRGYYVPVAAQTLLLFSFGVGYGYLVSQLHRTGNITPVPVHVGDQGSSYYLLFWGLFGVLLGNGLPLLDALWKKQEVGDEKKTRTDKSRARSSDRTDSALNPLWYSAVRSIGAFVGIAFAVRRVPWTSTLQVSLTLTLANPVLWYLIDRSATGFAFSAFVGVAGASALLLVNPGFVPVPAIHQDTAAEQLGVYVWLAGILFCTSLCFGAVGRKLQL
ncbi:hypothetical protein DV737_g2260, partial [Chaetothyriales sp. CBS 132003]